MRYPARFVSAAPSVVSIAGVQESVTAPFADCVTAIEKAGRDDVALPSLTRMTMFEYAPTCAAVGVPDNCPVLVLNVAHAGRFVIENVSGSPFASEAVGRKAYATPALTEVAGTPLMTGAALDDASTAIVKAGRDAVALPSLTRMTMLAYVPTFEDVRVQVRRSA